MSAKMTGLRKSKGGEALFIRMDPALLKAAREASWKKFGQLRLYISYLVAKDTGNQKAAKELEAQGRSLVPDASKA